MKTRKLLLFIVSLSFLLAIVGCSNACSKAKETTVNIPDLPNICAFSGTEYVGYDIHFSDVVHVTYRVGSVAYNIEPDDPRIVRLLNFIAYSEELGSCMWQQGYLSDDEVSTLLSFNYPRLEIDFSVEDAPCSNNFNSTPRIIVCGDSCLLYTPEDVSPEIGVANRCWPYGELVVELIVDGQLDNNVISFDGWGVDYWIDLLEYAGFVTVSCRTGDSSIVSASDTQQPAE